MSSCSSCTTGWPAACSDAGSGLSHVTPQLQRVVGFLGRAAHLTRPQIAVQAAAYMVLGAYLGQGLTLDIARQITSAALVVGLIVSFGFVINDYADVEVDRLTKPFRPLPAGEFTPPEALLVALSLAIAALGVALTLPPILFAIACANLVLTSLYALVLKGTVLLGNVAVAVLNSSVLVFGALAGGGITPLLLSVAAMSLLYTLAQEVLYTVDDLDGDGAAGLTTTAIFLGFDRSLCLFRGLIVLAMVAALAPLWIGATSSLYLLSLLACTLGPVMLYIVPLTAQGTPEAVTRACAAVKVVRLTSLIPLILL